METKKGLVKKESYRKYFIIGIIILLAVGIFWAVNHVDFKHTKDKEKIESNLNNNSSLDFLNLEQYGVDFPALITLILLFSMIMVGIGIIVPLLKLGFGNRDIDGNKYYDREEDEDYEEEEEDYDDEYE